MEPLVLAALVAGIVSLTGSLFVFFASRSKTRLDYKAALDARIDERVSAQLESAWAQNDAQATLLKAQTGELTALKREFKSAIRYIVRLQSALGARCPPVPADLTNYLKE